MLPSSDCELFYTCVTYIFAISVFLLSVLYASSMRRCFKAQRSRTSCDAISNSYLAQGVMVESASDYAIVTKLSYLFKSTRKMMKACIFRGSSCCLDFRRLVLVLHARAHQHIVIPLDRSIFGRMLLINTRWQACDNRFGFRGDEVRNGVSTLGHAVVTGETILPWGKRYSMDCGFQGV